MGKSSKKPKRKAVETPFAKNLNKVLKERNISMRGAAELAGCPYSTLAEWTAGATPGDLNAVGRLAKALNLSFEWLLLGTDQSEPVGEIPLSDIFEEEKTPFEGVFKITAVQLVRRGKDSSQ